MSCLTLNFPAGKRHLQTQKEMQTEFLLTTALSLLNPSFAPSAGMPGIPSQPAHCVFQHWTKLPSGFTGGFFFQDADRCREG